MFNHLKILITSALMDGEAMWNVPVFLFLAMALVIVTGYLIFHHSPIFAVLTQTSAAFFILCISFGFFEDDWAKKAIKVAEGAYRSEIDSKNNCLASSKIKYSVGTLAKDYEDQGKADKADEACLERLQASRAVIFDFLKAVEASHGNLQAEAVEKLSTKLASLHSQP